MSTVQLYNPFDNLEVLRNSANLFTIAGETLFNQKTLLDIVKRAFVFLSAVFFFSEVKSLVEHVWAVYNRGEQLNFIKIAIALVNMAFIISPIAYLVGMRHWAIHLLASSSIVVPYATKLFYDPARENCDKMLTELPPVTGILATQFTQKNLSENDLLQNIANNLKDQSNGDSALGSEAKPSQFNTILATQSREKELSENDLLQNIARCLKDEPIKVEYRELLNALITKKMKGTHERVNNNSNELQDEKNKRVEKIQKWEQFLSNLDKFILFAVGNFAVGLYFQISKQGVDREEIIKYLNYNQFYNLFQKVDLEFIKNNLNDADLKKIDALKLVVQKFLGDKNDKNQLSLNYFKDPKNSHPEIVAEAAEIKKVVLEELIADILILKEVSGSIKNELSEPIKKQLELWRKVDIYVSGSMVGVGGVFVGSTVARALYNYPLPLLETICYLILALYIIYDLVKKFYLHHITNQNQEIKKIMATS